MEELVRYIASTLVDHPEQVQVKTVDNPESVIIELSVGPDDMGKVIGKQGRIAKSIRSVVKAATARSEKPVLSRFSKRCKARPKKTIPCRAAMRGMLCFKEEKRMQQEYLQIGEIVRPQGIRGEVKLRAMTEDMSRYARLESVFLKKNGRMEEKRCSRGAATTALRFAA